MTTVTAEPAAPEPKIVLAPGVMPVPSPPPATETQAGQAGTPSPESGRGPTKLLGRDFGLHEIGEIELDAGLRTRFEGFLGVYMAQLREYDDLCRSKGNNNALTPQQRRLLELYEKHGNVMLDTADGWVLANLAMEQEMFLRLARLEKDIVTIIKERGIKPNEHGEYLIGRRDIEQGLLARWGQGARDFIQNALKKIPGAFSSQYREARFRLEDLEIDISALPQQYLDYIDYMNPQGTDPKKVAKFMEETDQARKDFYKALGKNPSDLDAGTPWERFRYQPQVSAVKGGLFRRGAKAEVPEKEAKIALAMENLDVNWMRIRNDCLREIIAAKKGPGDVLLNMKDPKHVAWVMFEAQQRTIKYFLDRRLDSIDSGKLDDYQRSIGTMTQRRDSIGSPDSRRLKIERMDRSIRQKETEIEDEEATLKQAQTDLKTKKQRKKELDDTQARDDQDEKKLSDEIDQRREGIRKIEERRSEEEKKEEGEIEDVSSDSRFKTDKEKESARLRIERRYQKIYAAFKTQIDELTDGRAAAGEENLDELEKKLKDVRTRIEERERIDEEIRRLEERIREITEITIPNLVQDHDRLIADKRNAGDFFTTDEREIIGKYNAAITAVSRFGKIREELSDTKTRYTLEFLTDTATDRVCQLLTGEDLPLGYRRFLDLIFDLEHPPGTMKPNEYLKRAMEILPMDQLAIILEAEFGITNGVSLMSDQDRLRQVFRLIGGRSIYTQDLRRAFSSIINDIEDKGLHLPY